MTVNDFYFLEYIDPNGDNYFMTEPVNELVQLAVQFSNLPKGVTNVRLKQRIVIESDAGITKEELANWAVQIKQNDKQTNDI